MAPGTGPARLLDMVAGRSKQAFKQWLAEREPAWRDHVALVAMDGFTGFKTATTIDGHERPARGACGDGSLGAAYLIAADGASTRTGNMTQVALLRGQRLHGEHGGGGGYADPTERLPEMVLHDYLEGYISANAEVYGVAITEERTVDEDATNGRRVVLRAGQQ